MNFRTRIAKLERKTNINGFCNCRETPKSEIYWKDSTSDAETGEQRLMGEPVPEVCPRCNRKVEKSAVVLEFIESQIPKPI